MEFHHLALSFVWLRGYSRADITHLCRPLGVGSQCEFISHHPGRKACREKSWSLQICSFIKSLTREICKLPLLTCNGHQFLKSLHLLIDPLSTPLHEYNIAFVLVVSKENSIINFFVTILTRPF